MQDGKVSCMISSYKEGVREQRELENGREKDEKKSRNFGRKLNSGQNVNMLENPIYT